MEPNSVFVNNFKMLINFPVQDENVVFRADKTGRLSAREVNPLKNIASSELNTIVTIINQTCDQAIIELGAKIDKVKNSEALEEDQSASTHFNDFKKLVSNVSAIKKIFQKRFQETEAKRIIKKLDAEIEKLEDMLQKTDLKIRDIGQQIYDKIENGFHTFEVEADNMDTNKAYAELPEKSSWYSTFGYGPTMLGTFTSGINTTRELISGFFTPLSYNKSDDPLTQAGRARLANVGKQLGSEDVRNFIRGISSSLNQPVNDIIEFFTLSSINQVTLEAVNKRLLRLIQDQDYVADAPIIIPLLFSGEGIWERGHITVVVIKDNCVEYYDPKGIRSENKFLKDGNKLFDVLVSCKNKFTTEGTIYENPYTHQFDAHNCGVFVCRFIYECLTNNRVMGELKVEPPPIQELEKFRETIIKYAYPDEAHDELPQDESKSSRVTEFDDELEDIMDDVSQSTEPQPSTKEVISADDEIDAMLDDLSPKE